MITQQTLRRTIYFCLQVDYFLTPNLFLQPRLHHVNHQKINNQDTAAIHLIIGTKKWKT